MSNSVELKYARLLPDSSLIDFIYCFWHLENTNEDDKSTTILPDGYFDILFTSVNEEPFTCILIGLATKPITCTVPAHSRAFAISFKLPAGEFILKQPISYLLNKSKYLPKSSEWFECVPTSSLHNFASTAANFINRQLVAKMKTKKLILFDLIYSSNGGMSINQISEITLWKSRQVNRYFQTYFGISLKTYCSILRFRASFDHLDKGIIPEEQFYDQPHFIREVNKFAGTTPKELAKNPDDRFIQLSTLSAS